MVRFVTLFLGVLVGAHDVEVMVGGDVAAVEILLDGEGVARIEGEPWTARVDFGDRLDTQRLEAVAYDAAGAELDRTSQPINRPRPQAEVALLVEHDDAGQPTAVRLEWQSTAHDRPSEVHVTLDGEQLFELEPHRFELPELDLEELHLVQADVHFDGGLMGHAQATVGGGYLDEASGELTAVLISLTGRNRSLRAEEMAGWFVLDGSPLRVMAVEKGPVELVVVRSVGAASAAARMDDLGFSGSGWMGSRVAVTPGSDQARTALSLPSHYRLRMLAPRATRVHRGRLSFEAFLISPSMTHEMGVYWALWQRFSFESDSPRPRLNDAVAMAGLQAAAGKRRRAVLLATGDESPDFSTIEPAVAVDYLERLGVPLIVWHLGQASPPVGWPVTESVPDFQQMKRALLHLRRQVDRQRVIWLDGRHDPRRIELVERKSVARIGRF